MNIAIMDDNAKDGRVIEQFISDYLKKHNYIVPFYTFIYQKEEIFFDALKKEQFDLIFIDYFLEQLTGIQVAKEVRKVDPSAIIIFITCSRDYAIESYKVKASGYLVKPVTFRDFEETMSLIDNKKMRDNKYIVIKNGHEHERVRLKEIVTCGKEGHYVQLQLSTGQLKRSRDSFSQFIKVFEPCKEFVHCYRGMMINMDYIKEISEITIIMKNGEYIPFRLKEREIIIKRYYDYLFESNRAFV